MTQRRILTRSPGRLAVALVAALALAGGCSSADGDPDGDPGSGDPGTGPGSGPTAGGPTAGAPAGGDGPDPCTLLTEDEVSAAAGAEVTGTEGPTAGNQGSTCRWSYPAAVLGEVTVSVWVGQEFYSPDTFAEGWEELAGIGDAAHQATGPLCTTIFRVGEIVVQVLSSDAPDDACVDLARTAAGRV